MKLIAGLVVLEFAAVVVVAIGSAARGNGRGRSLVSAEVVLEDPRQLEGRISP